MVSRASATLVLPTDDVNSRQISKTLSQRRFAETCKAEKGPYEGPRGGGKRELSEEGKKERVCFINAILLTPTLCHRKSHFTESLRLYNLR